MEPGDVPKSIKCYMNETGASQADAHEHVNSLMCETWKKMNEEVFNYPFSQSFTKIAMNLARMALYMFQHGDGHTDQDPKTKDRMLSLLIHPIPILVTKK